MNNLIIRIVFGSDAMLDPFDAANAIESDALPALYDGRTSGTIRDINGNTVGNWEIN